MSAVIVLHCDRQLRDEGTCGSQATLLAVDIVEARRLAATGGWTHTAAGDACPSCSRTGPRPSLRDRIGWSQPEAGPGLRDRIGW